MFWPMVNEVNLFTRNHSKIVRTDLEVYVAYAMEIKVVSLLRSRSNNAMVLIAMSVKLTNE